MVHLEFETTKLHNKKTDEGYQERIDLLAQHLPQAGEVVADAMNQFPRSQVARDDIVDALVALIVASTSEPTLMTLPSQPPRDRRGLPMEMLYASTPDLTQMPAFAMAEHNQSDKQAAMRTIEQLPDDASMADIMYHLYRLEKALKNER